MAPAERDPAPRLEYVAGDGTSGRDGWVDRNGQQLDTIDKLADHLAAAVANRH